MFRRFLSFFGPEARTDFLPGGHVRDQIFVSHITMVAYEHPWGTDFYMLSVLGGAALCCLQRQRFMKILCPKDPLSTELVAPSTG